MAGKDRKKELARQRYERQQERRRAQEARARRVRIIGAVAAVAVIAGGGAGIFALTGKDDSSDAAEPQAQAKATPKPGECAYTAAGEAGAPKDLGTPPVKPIADGPLKATMKTSQGKLGLELDGAKAPCTTNSFAFLAEKKFFEKTSCHRLSTSEGLKMLQCGDPTGTGKGGPGYQFANENTEGATYSKGTLAMANSGPDTNGSQFFLVYGDSQLPPNYSVFGKITSGLDVLDKVAKGGVDKPGDDGTGEPKKKVTIDSVTIAGK
ncbi:peptidylprolyl isomerase [Actinomadura viridis]|uniref:Peptidyl-prolyl cis-trans isomerase n=1 Tax=Actinomadura viridis TaxID=58110 RepID=A0A931DHN8_9ACTN|nr:peptidylprolyl isomerase [Actinomadura viridis]MBG6090250.1 peptidyl-prolyl cis-trans isomerase B (cyclophilin B) [Actinomadura viridis]